MIFKITGVLVDGSSPIIKIPTIQNISNPKGDDATIDLTIVNSAGTAVDITNAVIYFTVKRTIFDTHGLISRLANIVSGPSGTATITLGEADTATLSTSSDYIYDIWYAAANTGNRDQIVPLSSFIVAEAAGPDTPVTAPPLPVIIGFGLPPFDGVTGHVLAEGPGNTLQWINPASAGNYQVVKANGTARPAESSLNFLPRLTAVDNSGAGSTDIDLANTAVTPGSYTLSSFTVDAQGRLTAASSGAAVTNVATGTGLTGGPITSTGTVSLANTAVTAGSYTLSSFTVDAQGRLTAASSGSAVTSITTGAGLTGGPITSTGTISIPSQGGLAAGSYTNTNLTVDDRGIITAIANGSAEGSSFYQTIKDGAGSDQTQRAALKFTSAFTLSDNASYTQVDLTNPVSLATISTPSSPSSGTIKFYANTVHGIDTPSYINSTGVETVMTRDTVLVVKNITGGTLTKGTVVYINGASASIATIDKAKADSTMSQLPAAGVINVSLNTNTVGTILTHGELSGIDTSAFTVGDTIYVSASSSGALTNVIPTHPNVEQAIGIVTVSDVTNGAIAIDFSPINIHRIDGTNQPTFSIGDGTGTTKSYKVKNTAGIGTLSWNPSANQTLTLPDATDTIVGKATTDTFTNKTISGSSNTLSNIANGSLTNSSVTVTAGSGLSGGGTVSLGGTITLSLTSTPLTGSLTSGRIDFSTGASTVSDSANLLWDNTNNFVTIIRPSLGTTQNTGLSIQNNTAASSGAQQYSPFVEIAGQGWTTSAGGSSQKVGVQLWVKPLQGTGQAAISPLICDVLKGDGTVKTLFQIGNTAGGPTANGGGRNCEFYTGSTISDLTIFLGSNNNFFIDLDSVTGILSLAAGGNAIKWDNANFYPAGNPELGKNGNPWFATYSRQYVSQGTTPTHTDGTGAGTSPTVTITGHDSGGTVTVLTGTSCAASASVTQINFNQTWPVSPNGIVLTPANTAAAALTGNAQVYIDQASTTTAHFIIKVGSTQLNDATTYIWNYNIIG